MSEEENKRKVKGVNENNLISWLGLSLSMFSIIVAFWSVTQSNASAKIDRRVDTIYSIDQVR